MTGFNLRAYAGPVAFERLRSVPESVRREWLSQAYCSPQLTAIRTMDFIGRRGGLEASLKLPNPGKHTQGGSGIKTKVFYYATSIRRQLWSNSSPSSSGRHVEDSLRDADYLAMVAPLLREDYPTSVKREIQGLIDAARHHLSSSIIIRARQIANSIDQYLAAELSRSLDFECLQKCQHVVDKSRVEFTRSTRDILTCGKDE